MQFRVLGPVGLWLAGDEVDLGPARQRGVLAVLLLSHGRPLPTDTLVERVWGDQPPTRASAVLYNHVARLRTILHDAAGVRLTRTSAGYLLAVEASVIDACRFHSLLAAADTAGGAYPAIRVGLLREALDLWHGEPLSGLSGAWFDRTRERLRRQHIGALVACFEVELELGRHAVVVNELCELVDRHPTVEPLVGQLMLALYRSGRQTEALDLYRQTRRTLVDQQGLEPGPALRLLEQAILTGDRR
jgi:DNA-binding SARP family transcriptional activator